MFRFNLWLYIGYKCTQQFQWESADGYVDLTDWTALMHVRRGNQDEVLIETSTDAGTIILGENGWITLNFDVPDTLEQLDGVWSLSLKDPNLVIHPRVIYGRAKIIQPVTIWP